MPQTCVDLSIADSKAVEAGQRLVAKTISLIQTSNTGVGRAVENLQVSTRKFLLPPDNEPCEPVRHFVRVVVDSLSSFHFAWSTGKVKLSSDAVLSLIRAMFRGEQTGLGL